MTNLFGHIILLQGLTPLRYQEKPSGREPASPAQYYDSFSMAPIPILSSSAMLFPPQMHEHI